MRTNKKILVTFSLYLLTFFLICFIGISNVFGYTYQDLGYLSSNATVNVQTNYHQGLLNLPKDTYLQLYDVFSIDVFVSNISWQANNTYEIELNLVGTTLNSNANRFTVINYLSNGEETCTNEPGTIYDGNYPRFAFKCPHSISSFYLRIYNSEMNYILPSGEFRWNYVYGRLRTSSDTQDIINNDNQNTQNIINNQNQNTQNIIDSNKVCTQIDKNNAKSNYYINNNGEEIYQSGLSWGATDYINIYNSQVTVLEQYTSSSTSTRVCYYNINKEKISCLPTNEIQIGILNYPTNAYYMRSSIQMNINKPQFEICKNGNQAIVESNEEAETTRKGILSKLKELFDTLFSDDDADISGLDNMVGWLPPGPVDSIINLPLAFFNALTNTLTGTCQSVSIPIPFVNETLILPCFDAYMSQYLTGFSTLWTLVGTILSVFILYYYLLSLYKWVDDTLTFRENNLPGYYDDNWGGGA